MSAYNRKSDLDDETLVELELETVVERALAEFDEVSAITVDHLLTYEQPKTVDVRVHTGDSDVDGPQEYQHLFSDEYRLKIDRSDETLLPLFFIVATNEGPFTADSTEQTTIYLDQMVIGAQPLQLDDGVAYLRDKLENPDEWAQDQALAVSVDQIRNYTD
jgi:hypothetical protein